MRTLGVNVANDLAYLAVADAQEVVDMTPGVVKFAEGLPQDEKLTALRDEVRKIIAVNKVTRVNILSAESTYKATYPQMTTRITIETIFALAAAESGISCRRVSRPFVRSALDLPKSGKLAPLADSYTSPVGSSWNGKRSLAAVAALCHGGE